MGSILGWGNKIPQVGPCSQKEKVCRSVYSATTSQLDNWRSKKEGRERGRREEGKGKKKKQRESKKKKKTAQRKKKPWLKLNLPTSVVSLLPLWWIQVTKMMSLNVNSGRDMTTGYTIMCIIASSVADSLVCILVILCNNCSEYRSYFNIALCFLAQLYSCVFSSPVWCAQKHVALCNLFQKKVWDWW